MDVYKQPERIVSSILNSGDGNIICIDRFLGDDVIRLLCHELVSKNEIHCKFKRIVLRGNCIGSIGAESIATLLLNEKLEVEFISLEWNQLGSVGSICLANALERNNSLTHLDLRNNSVDTNSAIALANSLNNNNNNTLRVLDLRWNQIEDRGALVFKDAVIDRDPPLNVLFNGNLLTEQVVKTIIEWLSHQENKENNYLNKTENEVNKSMNTTNNNNNSVAIYQNDLLQKEITNLRSQCISLQKVFADVQRFK